MLKLHDLMAWFRNSELRSNPCEMTIQIGQKGPFGLPRLKIEQVTDYRVCDGHIRSMNAGHGKEITALKIDKYYIERSQIVVDEGR